VVEVSKQFLQVLERSSTNDVSFEEVRGAFGGIVTFILSVSDQAHDALILLDNR